MDSKLKISEYEKACEDIISASSSADKKLSARDRILNLLDEGSFIELDMFIKDENEKASSVITGYGSVDGRPVYIYSQDYSILKGSVGKMHVAKISKVMDLATKNGAPVIGILDSCGGKVGQEIDTLEGYGEIFKKIGNISGVVPQISIVLGVCAGSAIFIPTLSDVVIMSENAKAFFNSPVTTTNNLVGTTKAASENGLCDILCGDDMASLNKAREVLAFLPDNNLSGSYMFENGDDLNRICQDIENILPNDSFENYDIKNIINEVFDNGTFMQLKKDFAKSIICGFANLGGFSVGIVANNTLENSGSLTAKGSVKASKFIRFCDSFNIPVITLVDTMGFDICPECEIKGGFQKAAKLVHAYSEATTPKITLVIRKAYGSAYLAMGSKSLGADLVYAWPTAEICTMNPTSAAEFLYSDKIGSATDPEKARTEAIEDYKNNICSPLEIAKSGKIDNVITPSATRQLLISAVMMLSSKRENKLSKKHSNMPL